MTSARVGCDLGMSRKGGGGRQRGFRRAHGLDLRRRLERFVGTPSDLLANQPNAIPTLGVLSFFSSLRLEIHSALCRPSPIGGVNATCHAKRDPHAAQLHLVSLENAPVNRRNLAAAGCALPRAHSRSRVLSFSGRRTVSLFRNACQASVSHLDRRQQPMVSQANSVLQHAYALGPRSADVRGRRKVRCP